MRNLFIFITLIVISACSIFQTAEKKDEVSKEEEKVDEVYVFDEVTEEEEAKTEKIEQLEQEINNSLNKEKPDQVEEVDVFGEQITDEVEKQAGESKSYFLQLGAFSDLKRAERYVSEIKPQVPFDLSIIYNSQTSFYTVRSSSYSTKQQVEQLRDDFWTKNLFKDAFIVTE